MDWKRFDRARRTVGPEELDLIESYAEGRINRRDFVRRGTVIGLSVPFLGAVIAACGGDDDDATTGTDDGTARTRRRHRHDAGHRTVGHRWDRDPGRRHPGRLAEAGRPARPDRHAGPRLLRHRRPVLRVPRHARRQRGRQHRARSRRVVGAERGRQRLDVQPAPGRQVARRHRLHVGRRRRHVRPPVRGRQRRPERRHRPRLGRRHRSRPWPWSRCSRRTATSRTSCRSTTPSRSSRRSRSTTGTTLDGVAERHRPVEAEELRRRHRRRVRAQPRLVGRHDAARRQRVELLRRRGLDGDGRVGRRGRHARPVPGHRWRRAVQRPRTSPSSASRPPPTARSGCVATRASSPIPGSARRSACASTARR